MVRKMTIEEMISELDAANGMLVVAAMRDKTVKAAMEKVIDVSIALGFLTDEEG